MFDTYGNGLVNLMQMRNSLQNLGEKLRDEEIDELIREVFLVILFIKNLFKWSVRISFKASKYTIQEIKQLLVEMIIILTEQR